MLHPAAGYCGPRAGKGSPGMGQNTAKHHSPLAGISSFFLPSQSIGLFLSLHFPVHSTFTDILSLHFPVHSTFTDTLSLHFPVHSTFTDILSLFPPYIRCGQGRFPGGTSLNGSHPHHTLITTSLCSRFRGRKSDLIASQNLEAVKIINR